MAPSLFLMPLLLFLCAAVPAHAGEPLAAPAEKAEVEDPVIFTGERSPQIYQFEDPFELVEAAQRPYAGKYSFLKVGQFSAGETTPSHKSFPTALHSKNLPNTIARLKINLQQQPRQTVTEAIESLIQRRPLHTVGLTVKSWLEPGAQRFEKIQTTLRTKLSNALEKIGTNAQQAAEKIR